MEEEAYQKLLMKRKEAVQIASEYSRMNSQVCMYTFAISVKNNSNVVRKCM